MTIKLTKDAIDIGIVVRDAEAALGFYRDTLGFEDTGTTPVPGGGSMYRLLCGTTLVKLVAPEGELPAANPPGGIRGGYGIRYWTISVPDVDALTATCADAGYTVALSPREIRAGVRISIIEDPDGNWVELLQVTPQGCAAVRRLVAGCALAVTLLTVVAPAARATAAPPDADESALLAAYAPVVSIRHQAEPCGEGERYLPVSVDHVLGRDDVVLRDSGGAILQRAPTAESLPRDDANVWMDLPGNALTPGCSYEQWFKPMHASPAVYGRVTYEDGDTVVQYWLYWVFNQWNDLHEGDWEMVQLIFEAPTAGAAMQAGPTLFAYAQHEGSEVQVAGPDGGVRLVDGTHPVVFSGEGSHASYFAPDRWFGKSGATGFGCDNTDEPSDALRPEVIALPGDDIPTSGPLAWLGFTGHWGEQQVAFNNGPTGPSTKTQWSDPIGWVVDEGRDGAVAIPFADSKPIETFCSLAAKGSALFNHLLDHPLVISLAIVATVVAAVLVVRFSSRGVLGRAAHLWRRSARRLLPIGLVLFAGAAIAAVLLYLVREHTAVGTLMETAGQSSPWVLPIVTVVGSLVAIPAVAWVMVASIAVDEGATSAGAALVAPWRALRTAVLAAIVLVFVIETGLFGLIVALLASRWLVAPVIAVRDRVSLRESLGRSNRMMRGSSWRSLGLLATLLGIAFLTGLTGALLLALTDASFLAASILSALMGVVIVPYVAMVLVAYHDDLVARMSGWRGG